MDESDVETILQRAREAHPGVKPWIMSDNGPQFIAKDFKEFIRLAGMKHVRAVRNLITTAAVLELLGFRA